MFDGNVKVINISPNNSNNSPVYKTMGIYGLMPASGKNDGKRSQKDMEDNKIPNRIIFSTGKSTGRLMLMSNDFMDEFCKITFDDGGKITKVESVKDENEMPLFLTNDTVECLKQKVGDDVYYNLICNQVNPAKRKKKTKQKK